jgi:hypothetical protein
MKKAPSTKGKETHEPIVQDVDDFYVYIYDEEDIGNQQN